MATELKTPAEVIEKLGGTKGVAALTGAKPPAISNWRRSKFPAWFKDRMLTALAERNFTAPPSLWGQR